MKTRRGYAAKITLPKWNVPLQTAIIKDREARGYCLVACNDLVMGGREMCFERAR